MLPILIKQAFVHRQLFQRSMFLFSQNKEQPDDEQSLKQQDDAQSQKQSPIAQNDQQRPIEQIQTLSKYQKRYRNHLIKVIQESEPQRPKGTEDYRVAILFNEVLSKQKLIELYNTHGRIFLVNFWKQFFLAAFGIGAFYYLYEKKRWIKRGNDRAKLAICFVFILSRFHMYRKVQKYHVEKLVYSTESKNFIVSQRNFIGMRCKHELPKDKLLFTQDKYLNARNINYINIDTMDCYQIGYIYAWKNKELFTHLIKQNIQSIRDS